MKNNAFYAVCRECLFVAALISLGSMAGCLPPLSTRVPDQIDDTGRVARYQQALLIGESLGDADANDLDEMAGLATPGLMFPDASSDSNLDAGGDPLPRELTLAQAITSTLAHSQEIHVISYDPALAEQEVKKSAGDFDMSAFGRTNYDNGSKPTSSFSDIGESDAILFESGVKQRSILGSEWSASYLVTRNWDDLPTRNPETRYEPVLAFQLKQPLMRDAWQQVNLAGVDIAKLNYQIALHSFHQKAEDITTETIAAYWQLVQARRDCDIQENVLQLAVNTLDKVKGRQEIDATDVQIQQTYVSEASRRALLLQAQKRVSDALDILKRLMADPDMDLLDGVEIIPTSKPHDTISDIDATKTIQLALKHNPVIQQARTQIDIADINILVANNQKMPRLDLVASVSDQGLDRDFRPSHKTLNDGFESYGVGLTMEIPLGNRVRRAELRRRRMERTKAAAVVRNIQDQIVVQAKERIRRVQTSFAEIQVQTRAIEASTAHLSALENQEEVREKLTPEFLLVKLQAQDSLAQAQRAQAQAITDYNVALAQLAQTTGRVLRLHEVNLPEVAK
jgi:outer membrane protein